MNPNESEFEERLRSLTPAAPPPQLGAAIAGKLSVRERALAVGTPATAIIRRPARSLAIPPLLRNVGWAFAGACAAVAAIVALERTGESQPLSSISPSVPAPAFDFAESSAEILTTQDEGFVFAADEAPARQVRVSSIERHVWTNASTGARMEIEIPREDIRLMPVALQ